jgi:hypothetical protein
VARFGQVAWTLTIEPGAVTAVAERVNTGPTSSAELPALGLPAAQAGPANAEARTAAAAVADAIPLFFPLKSISPLCRQLGQQPKRRTG